MIEPNAVIANREINDPVDIGFARELGVEHERVAARTAGEEIVAAFAVDDVRAGIAVDRVGEWIARQSDRFFGTRVDRAQDLYPRRARERIAHAGIDNV